MKSFSEFPLSALLKSNLSKNGFKEPTAVQAQAIEPALAGRDVVATAQTGTGKTLAFVLPLIHLLAEEPARSGVRAVVLSPTRELALQIHETFVKMAAGQFRARRRRNRRSRRKLAIASHPQGRAGAHRHPRPSVRFSQPRPGRSGQRPHPGSRRSRPHARHGLPAHHQTHHGRAFPAERQTLFFSATIESSVKHLVETHVRNAVRVEVGSTTKPVDKIDLHLYEVEPDRKLGLLQLMLARRARFVSGLRPHQARRGPPGQEAVARRLQNRGYPRRPQPKPAHQALRGFQDGYYRVLVATDIAARGIHVEGISHVVNYDLPQVPEDFIHRVGRTGRAGAGGTASTFATRAERADIAHIERILATRLVRRQVSPEVAREVKTAAPVIEIASASPRPQHRRVRSFAPRRRAV